jgi:hypothetical protein
VLSLIFLAQLEHQISQTQVKLQIGIDLLEAAAALQVLSLRLISALRLISMKLSGLALLSQAFLLWATKHRT